MNLEHRQALCDKYNLCFVSLKTIVDGDKLVWHNGLNDSVWVKAQYEPANAMQEVREKMALKTTDAVLLLDHSIPKAEAIAFGRRTFQLED